MYIPSKTSIVIPSYFRQIDLSELFDSILMQTITPVEVIVVDDTPNDSIKIVCEGYELKFKKINTDLKYIRNPKERGITIARNVGVEIALGDIIIFLDSDTIFHQKYIEKILEVFNDNSNALGVQGWIINHAEYNKINYLMKIFAKIFYLHYNTKNSCNFMEYPIILSNIINCTWLSGSNMAYKKDVFNEFRFDEKLKGYATGEDKLFSHSIFQKHPNSLFITPHAKIIHKVSEEGRLENKELIKLSNNCLKYVLRKLFGFKGLLRYHRQSIGRSIIRIINRYLF